MFVRVKHISFFLLIIWTLVLLPSKLVAQDARLVEKIVREDINKATVLIQQNKLNEARELLNKVRKASSDDLYMEGIAEADYLLGEIALKEGDEKTAYSFYWRSYGLARVSGDNRLEMQAVIRIGDIFYDIPSYRRAIDFYKVADSLVSFYYNAQMVLHIYERLASSYYHRENYQEALFFYGRMKAIAHQNNVMDKELEARFGIANCYVMLLDFDNAVEYYLQLVPHYKRIGNEREVSRIYYVIGHSLKRAQRETEAKKFFQLALNSPGIYDSLKVQTLLKLARMDITQISSIPKSEVLEYLAEAEKIAEKNHWDDQALMAMHYRSLMYFLLNEDAAYENELGRVLEKLKTTDATLAEKISIYQLAVRYFTRKKNYKKQSEFEDLLAEQKHLQALHKLEVVQKKLELEKRIASREREIQMQIMDEQLSYADHELIKRKNEAQAAELQAQRHRMKMQAMEEDHQRQQLEAERQKLELEKKRADILEVENELIKEKDRREADSLQAAKVKADLARQEQQAKELRQRQYYLRIIVGIGLVLVILLVLFYISVRKKNKILHRQNKIIVEEKRHTEEALARLKATKEKLIEAERLASLGELTAGIAHEIRNPLNFVNNFSKLNLELLDELKDELEGQVKDKEVLEDLEELLEMLASNNQKITEHGDRAASIVKQMLDSSRKDTKLIFEKADINHIVEQSATLGYQGVRGQHPGFSASLEFDLDEKIGEQMVVSQDLGRVIINLVGNASHALLDKLENQQDFKPKIKVQTRDLGDRYRIVVEDNGKGMPESVKSKIFDPFFTTKPSGKGTGLGLTMSYDIIVKNHKGSFDVETEEGVFTRFTIEIPKNIDPAKNEQ